jgi:hypothetical protein
MPKLHFAFPASASAGAPSAHHPTRDEGPSRRSRAPRDLGPLLAACAIVAVFGWILLIGDPDRVPVRTVTDPGLTLCGAGSCVTLVRRVPRPLPREWRWELKTYEFEHMYRD